MAKKDFKSQLKESTERKKEVNLELENEVLKEKLLDLKKAQDRGINVLSVSEIKLRSNIRDNYDYEEINQLKEDIEKNGQLQAVLISRDNFLLAGYRRFHALQSISKEQEILVYRLEKDNSDIPEVELKSIQFAENNQRRNIDNFQLSALFNWYLENGFSQKDVSEKFKKPKSVVSEIIQIKNIDQNLVILLKEIQLYGASHKKFVHTNSDEKQNELMEKKFFISYRNLYNLAKQKDLNEQKKIFLSSYKNYLTSEEINSDYFKEVNEQKNSKAKKTEVKSFSEVVSRVKSLNTIIENVNIEKIKGKDLENARKYIEKLELIFKK